MCKKMHILYMVGMLCLCLCLTGCSSNKNTVHETNKNEEFTNVSKPLSEDTQSNNEELIAQKNGLKDDTLVAVGKDEKGYGNLGVNIKEENNQVLLCKDPIYNIVYYVNYGVDYFIYRLKDGKAELVVEMPAKRLFCLNGKLYFMLKSYDTYTLKDMKDGNIFCYNPVSGEVTLICDVQASTMFVYEEGIYYKVEKTVDLEKGLKGIDKDLYFYSFALSKSEALQEEYITLYKWNDYFISYEVAELDENDELYKLYNLDEKMVQTIALKLETLDKSKTIKLTDNWNIRNYSIIGNEFYYFLNQKSLNIFNIETKKTKEIPLAISCSKDFTILNGIIYLDSLLRINPVTGQQSMIVSEKVGEVIYELYTDGINLYGICGSSGNGKYGVMKRIELIETLENAAIAKSNLGIDLEINRYVFRTLPMEEEIKSE